MSGPLVEVYTRADCQPSSATKQWLTDRGIAFVEHDARDFRDHLTSLGATLHTPVVKLSDSVFWSGHRPDLLAAHFPDTHVASPIATILANHRAVVSGMPGLQTSRGHCDRCGAVLDFVNDPLCGDCQMGDAA